MLNEGGYFGILLWWGGTEAFLLSGWPFILLNYYYLYYFSSYENPCDSSNSSYPGRNFILGITFWRNFIPEVLQDLNLNIHIQTEPIKNRFPVDFINFSRQLLISDFKLSSFV
jgi:hypothetical protein